MSNIEYDTVLVSTLFYLEILTENYSYSCDIHTGMAGHSERC